MIFELFRGSIPMQTDKIRIFYGSQHFCRTPLAPWHGFCHYMETMTEESFLQLCEQLSDHIWLQSLLLTVGTCHLEDAARCGIALLVAAGHLGWWMAFVCMVIGAIYGDVGLYLTGRFATQFILKRRWMDPARLSQMEFYFKHHAITTIIVGRFVPGIRGLACCAAGITRYPLPRYLLVLTIVSAVQALLFLWLGVIIGEKILPHLSSPRMRVALIVGVVLAIVLIHRLLALLRKRHRKRVPATLPPAP